MESRNQQLTGDCDNHLTEQSIFFFFPLLAKKTVVTIPMESQCLSPDSLRKPLEYLLPGIVFNMTGFVCFTLTLWYVSRLPALLMTTKHFRFCLMCTLCPKGVQGCASLILRKAIFPVVLKSNFQSLYTSTYSELAYCYLHCIFQLQITSGPLLDSPILCELQ